MRSNLETIPEGDAGLAVKLRRLRALVDEAKADPWFRRWTLEQVRAAGVRERDYAGELAAVARAARAVRYTRDPFGVELFQDPRLIAQDLGAGAAAGDCDDMVGLACAMSETLGHPTRFRVGGAGNGAWSHIWYDVLEPGKGWRAMDHTEKMRPAGWDPAPAFPLVHTASSTMHSRARSNRQSGAVSVLALHPSERLQGLEGFKIKKALRSVKKLHNKVTPKVIRKIEHKVSKTVTKALPALALVANVIPGVGQAASAGFAVAAVAARRRQQKKRAQAERDYAAESSRIEAENRAAMFNEPNPSPWPEQWAPGEVDAIYAETPAQSEPDPWQAEVAQDWQQQQEFQPQVEQQSEALYGLGDLSAIFGSLASIAPQALQAAQGGAFGNRFARTVNRFTGRLMPAQGPQGPMPAPRPQGPMPAPPPRVGAVAQGIEAGQKLAPMLMLAGAGLLVAFVAMGRRRR